MCVINFDFLHSTSETKVGGKVKLQSPTYWLILRYIENFNNIYILTLAEVWIFKFSVNDKLLLSAGFKSSVISFE